MVDGSTATEKQRVEARRRRRERKKRVWGERTEAFAFLGPPSDDDDAGSDGSGE